MHGSLATQLRQEPSDNLELILSRLLQYQKALSLEVCYNSSCLRSHIVTVYNVFYERNKTGLFLPKGGTTHSAWLQDIWTQILHSVSPLQVFPFLYVNSFQNILPFPSVSSFQVKPLKILFTM